ncbi:hypothetical protein K435DRAFT_816053 [Dendrothele bispora CBS 962.96]|uniref:Pali-domain-containing protein n=1 Tax=Dendrothele bispora (strain CBS 962.96) TaxID=1314807 RepID=A0A4S8MSS7_DENBC|nr:hypothetical protein K435DRAFT_816053 [Dendrothele bispora CBS 962.96]
MVKEHHKPFKAHRITSIVCLFLLTAAFILLLLVGISLPIVKPVYIMRVFSVVTGQPATSLATELRFGVWGVCATSALDQPTLLTNDGLCFGPQLGYDFDIPDDLLSRVGISQSLIQAVLRGLLVVLILHIVAAATSLVGLFFSLFLASHAFTIISLIITIITAVLSTVVFAVDLVIAITARSKIPDLTNDGFGVGIGNAVWMVLGAVIASWIAVILLSARACYCCAYRR